MFDQVPQSKWEEKNDTHTHTQVRRTHKEAMRKRRRRLCNATTSSTDSNDDDDSESSESTSEAFKRMCRHIYVTPDNHVHFRWECSTESMIRLESCIRQALSAVCSDAFGGTTPTLHVHIESQGGDAAATLRVYDWMTCLRNVRIVTWAEGYVASAGTVLLLAGDQRCILPNAVLMIHEVFSETDQSSNARWRCVEAEDDVAYTRMLTTKLCSVYACRTKIDSHLLTQLLRRDIPLDADTSLILGLVTEKVAPVSSSDDCGADRDCVASRNDLVKKLISSS